MTKKKEGSTRRTKQPLVTVACSTCGKRRDVKAALAEIYATRPNPYRCKECAEKDGPKKERSGVWGGDDVVLTCSICGTSKSMRPYLAAKRATPHKCLACSYATMPSGSDHHSFKPDKRITAICTTCGTEKSMEPRTYDKYAKPYKCSRCNKLQGAASPSWRGGEGHRGYDDGWTNGLKNRIRERDGHKCRVCGNPQPDRKLSVHHIDYNKKNVGEQNLITLCVPCHASTSHGNREEWQLRLTSMMEAA